MRSGKKISCLLLCLILSLTASSILKKDSRIYGISFTNGVYGNPALPPEGHHTQESYRELADLGVNTVRFYLNYGLFEDDGEPYVYKESGFDWIDRNIGWAEKYGIRLILNMHYPQGGYQSGGAGSALWTEEENRKRLTALWGELAERYAKEKTILGYGLLNEPTVPALDTYEETVGQWEELAQKLTDAVRAHDTKHRIYVERLQSVTGMENVDWEYDYRNPGNFISVRDENYALEFHYYSPMELTHQGVSWYGSRDGFYYPGAGSGRSGSPVWLEHRELHAEEAGKENGGDSGEDSFLTCGIPVERGSGVNLINLTAASPVEQIAVTEYGPAGEPLRTYFEGTDYAGDGEAALAGWNFQVTKGCSYRVRWRGPAVLRADYFDGCFGGVWDRESVEAELNGYLAVGEERGVPMYLGETGTSAYSMHNGLGGDLWLKDILAFAEETRLDVTVHCYRDENFGLYTDTEQNAPARNRSMYELLKEAAE